MTAPNTGTAVATVEAPTPDSFSDPMEAFEATIASTLKQSLSEPAEDSENAENAAGRARDDKGRFVAAADAVVPPTQATDASGQPNAAPGQEAVEGTPPADGANETEIVIPEGFAAVPALPDEKVAGRFTVRDAEGEIAAPDLTWKFTANGQPVEVSTDKLVAYAQMGKYNHDREMAMQETQTRAQQVEQRFNEARNIVIEQDKQIARLLSDPEYLLRAQVAYEQQNTPEARLQRDREALENERNQIQMQHAHAKSVDFVDNRLAPSLEMIVTKLPTVTREELAARLVLACDRYRQNGVLREEGFGPISQWILNDLLPWAEQVHDDRQSRQAAPKKEVEAVKAKAKQEIEQQQVRTQKAKNFATRALKPGGQAGPVGTRGGAPDPKSIRTGKDAESAVIGSTLAALRAG